MQVQKKSVSKFNLTDCKTVENIPGKTQRHFQPLQHAYVFVEKPKSLIPVVNIGFIFSPSWCSAFSGKYEEYQLMEMISLCQKDNTHKSIWHNVLKIGLYKTANPNSKHRLCCKLIYCWIFYTVLICNRKWLCGLETKSKS